MKITYFTGLKNLEPQSMQIYRKNLLRELKEINPEFEHKEYAMKHFELNINHFHFDRIFNRFILYQFAARMNYGQINHVLDHTYACALNLLPKKVKKIVTVHDLFLLKGRINEFKIFSVPGIKKADKIIAVSESTKRDLINLLQIQANKIEVVYEGVDKTLFKQKEVMDVHPKLRNKKIILNVANHEDRKNTYSLVKVFNNLIDIFPDLILIRVGKENKKTSELIKKLGLEEKIFYFENISDDKLVDLYNLADIFVFPSIKEGFGLPILEAMACGCPVVTSNTSSLPEIVGNAGIMINPYNLNPITVAVKKVLTDKNLRKKMMEKGLKQSKKFSWRETAKKTIRTYKEVYNLS